MHFTRRTLLRSAALAALVLAAGPVLAATPVLDPALRKKLDTFFSNFAETNLESFEAGKLSDEEMLRFAIIHVGMNARKELKLDAGGDSGTASAALVDKVTLRYFDQKIETGREPSYEVELGDGEAIFFAQITGLTDLGGGLYSARGNIYGASSGAVIDVHAAPSVWKKAGEDVERTATFEATIKAIEKRYVLVEYKTTPTE
jgi:hypothetical protein